MKYFILALYLVLAIVFATAAPYPENLLGENISGAISPKIPSKLPIDVAAITDLKQGAVVSPSLPLEPAVDGVAINDLKNGALVSPSSLSEPAAEVIRETREVNIKGYGRGYGGNRGHGHHGHGGHHKG